MPDAAAATPKFRTADLSQNRPTAFALAPEAEARAVIAEDLGLSALKKLSFRGEIVPKGKRGFELIATLGATVVQPCVVTLAPVSTRIDETVTRRYLPEARLSEAGPGEEAEMPEDDTEEPLGAEIDPHAVMVEALMLALPDYPRAEGAALDTVESRPEGAAPIRDEEVHPFAGLAGLRDRMKDDEGGQS